MSIKPIDIQGIVPKTQQLSKIIQQDNNKHKDFIQIQNVIENQIIKKELNRVNTKTSKSEVRIKRDDTDKGKRKFKNGDDHSEGGETAKKDSKQESIALGNIIDIKV